MATDPDYAAEGATLSALLAGAGLSAARLQDDFGFPGGQAMVYQNKTGRRPISPAGLKVYARALGMHPRDICPRVAATMLWEEPSASSDASNTSAGPRVSGRVPLISSVQAGAMADATDIYAPGYAEDFVSTTAPIHRHTYALRIKGDSMEPLIPDGYVVIVEPEADPREGDVVVAKNGDDEANVKLLVKVSGDWWLKPANRDYKPKPLGDAKIIGVVVAAERRFR